MRPSLAVLLLASLSAVPAAALAASDDVIFLEARAAFQRGDIARLDERAGKLDRNYPLAGHVEYWRLRSRLAETPAGQIENFLASNANSLVADRLRADWLRLLAKNRDWQSFLREFPKLSTEDVELTCLSHQARLAQGEDAILVQARSLWLSSKLLPESCLPLFEAMFSKGMLTDEDSWARIRLALELGNLSGARMLLRYLPPGERPGASTLESISQRPQRYLDRASLPLKTRAQRELAIFALYKTAENWPQIAATRLVAIEKQLADPEREYAWAQVATVAARNLYPDALVWFERANGRLDDRQRTWQARAALRAGDWSETLSAISAMSPEEFRWPQWRYWKARALSELGRQAEANVLLARLANEFNFYGLLAEEDLGISVSSAPQTYKPGEDELLTVAADLGIQRALTWYRNGLRYEGALEWQWTIKDYEDKQLLAAAQIAAENEWYERAIDTAERTEMLHDFGLRYPTPYRDVVRHHSDALGLDEAWVYGLVRQESRFVTTARSTAGASGLMQLMPSTARWLAKRLGISGHHGTLTQAVDTNISMGTNYLRQMLDTLDNHEAMASAGYNAGARRARAWAAGRPLEGAVYTETIPFIETREYVKKVMSNTMYYARLLRHPSPGLRERLGTVPARTPQSN